MPAGIYADTRGAEPKGRFAPMITFFTMVGEYFLFSMRVLWLGIKQPIRLGEMSEYFYFLGYKSLSICIFCGLFAGLSQTLFLGEELKDYGATDTIGRVLGVTSVRELGPLVVALMLIGKVGAAVAAELGSMKVNNQVDAIVGLGQDPERKLATPRVWALTLITFPLVVITNVAVLVGGWIITPVGTGMFWFQAQMALYMRHMSSSMVKPFVFGWMIATVACYFGLKTTGGVRGVGQAVSKTVVTCAIMLFIINAVVGAILIAFHGGL